MFNLSAICLSHKHSISRRIQKDWFGLDLYKLPFYSPSENSLLTGDYCFFFRFPLQLPILRKSIGHLLEDLVVGANHVNFPIIYLSVSHSMRGARFDWMAISVTAVQLQFMLCQQRDSSGMGPFDCSAVFFSSFLFFQLHFYWFACPSICPCGLTFFHNRHSWAIFALKCNASRYIFNFVRTRLHTHFPTYFISDFNAFSSSFSPIFFRRRKKVGNLLKRNDGFYAY